MVDVTPILTASGISAQSFNPTRNEQIADSSHNYAYRVPVNGLEVELEIKEGTSKRREGKKDLLMGWRMGLVSPERKKTATCSNSEGGWFFIKMLL
ncbi:hypothetical protein [Paenibacillus sp. JZ16]|uniref:hypothetical protein n=1 Tax=Paenibacillus sp. JZ16 TaxID=1906272 RepID=UPI00188DBD3B|nr:hypothetical protein [Paenibacillus sp. JZ16]